MLPEELTDPESTRRIREALALLDKRQLLLAAEPSEAVSSQLFGHRLAIEADEPPAVPYLVRRCHHELARRDGYEKGEEGYPPEMGWFTRAFAQWLWFAAPSS